MRLIRNYKATAAVAANLIVKPGAADNTIVPAAAATDALAGVSTNVPSDLGEPCDVIHTGIADVKLGGSVARGNYVTSDGDGKGVKCDPAAGTVAQCVGKALVSGDAGDIIPVLLGLGQITKPAA